MKPIIKSIVEALVFWGPSTPIVIASRLAMRGEHYSVPEITNAIMEDVYASNPSIRFALDLTQDKHTLPHNKLFKASAF
jgi:hypothetical protein